MIPSIEKSSTTEIKLFQAQLLNKQLLYLKENSPFYRKMFAQHQIDCNKIVQLEDLRQIPVTTKSDLQNHNALFFSVPQEKIIDFSSTSGTTGFPVTFGLSENDLQRLAYNEAISFACAGVTQKDKVQLMTTMDRRFMAGLAYFLGLRKLGAGIIRTGAGIPALQWESILQNKPSYLVAVPSFLLKMIEYAEKNNIDIGATTVKAAICIGEPLRNPDFSASSLAQRINDKWSIQLFSTYASTEMSTAFTECSFHCGGHAHPELIITEVLDSNNRPVATGEVGELTITTLGVEALPLLRYKTGDMVQLHEDPCKCGRNTLRVGPVVGRSQQMIKYKGTTLYPPAMHNVVNFFNEISAHLIVLSHNALGQDEVLVQLVSSNQSPTFVTQLKEHFQARIRVVPKIEFIDAEVYQHLVENDNNRKPRWVIDNRPTVLNC
jgi:phenylacetate-CoA ligase